VCPRSTGRRSASRRRGLRPKQRFIQEAKSASSLNHPNIITIHEIDQADGTDFMVMEFVAGKTLQQLIPSGGLPVTDVLKYAIPIASALAAANAAGIIHRDIAADLPGLWNTGWLFGRQHAAVDTEGCF